MPYQLADRAQTQLNKYALRRKEEVKQRLVTLKFDELNVMQMIDALYESLDRENRKKWRELWAAKYGEDEDEIDELLDMHLAGLLDEPNETTHYTYATEVLRKRDRAKEAMLSVPTKAQKQLELDKQVRIWLQMTGWYTDFVYQDAEITALKDAGVKRVKRHELMDGKTCAVCKKADGEVYDIDKVPQLPHLRCRRWFTKA